MKDWFDHDYMYVVGSIDAYGKIHAKAVGGFKGSSTLTHTKDVSKGKRFRWDIYQQRWGEVRRYENFTDEEQFAISDWLVRHGYAEDKSFKYA